MVVSAAQQDELSVLEGWGQAEGSLIERNQSQHTITSSDRGEELAEGEATYKDWLARYQEASSGGLNE